MLVGDVDVGAGQRVGEELRVDAPVVGARAKVGEPVTREEPEAAARDEARDGLTVDGVIGGDDVEGIREIDGAPQQAVDGLHGQLVVHQLDDQRQRRTGAAEIGTLRGERERGLVPMVPVGDDDRCALDGGDDVVDADFEEVKDDKKSA